jgi:predicted transcriptional regulator of viral defense system
MVTKCAKSDGMPTSDDGNSQNVTLRTHMDAIRKPCIATAAQWRAAGMTPAQLRSFVRLGYLIRVRRGVYATQRAIAVAKGDPRGAHALQVAAVRASIGHDVVGSHHSAALIHGFDLLKRPAAGIVTMTCRPPRRSRSRQAAGVLIHNAELPGNHVTRKYGTEVTTAARTVIDLARTSPFIEGVVAADSALHMGKTTKEELDSVCDACRRWPGGAQAKRVVTFSNGLAESVLESCARVVFADAGLEAPEVQVTIRGPGFVYRADFCWERRKTIAEADGLAKYVTREDMLAQFRRDRLLRDAGYKVVHFTWRELFESPELVIARIRNALSAATPY